MARVLCPECGARGHMSSGAPAYLERMYPELRVVGVIWRPCQGCAPMEPASQPGLDVGDTASFSGVFAEVVRVADCGPRGVLYRVRLRDGGERTATRRALAPCSS